MEVYLDHAATTRLDDQVLEAMMPYLSESYGNASSPHSLGRKARFAVEEARERIAGFLGAETGEIVFTSGGTESNNLALRSGLRSLGATRDLDPVTLVTSRSEHESVLEPARAIEQEGVEIVWIDPSQEGHVPPGAVAEAVQGRMGLVSIMHTNNETGAVNGLVDIAEACRSPRWLLHTDAVQALGWSELNVDDLGVDLMTLSAHKIYGPKGVGLLFVRADTVDLKPFVSGGSQERRRRGGTENVAAIVGFAKAAELVTANRRDRFELLSELKSRLAAGLRPLLDEGAILNTPADSAPHLLNVSFPATGGKPVDGEMLLPNLDVEGIRVSSGSACTSGSIEPSHVLLAMGRDHETASATVRFSFGKDNTLEEMDYVADRLQTIVRRMRS
jgi:cysteine desulfurase